MKILPAKEGVAEGGVDFSPITGANENKMPELTTMGQHDISGGQLTVSRSVTRSVTKWKRDGPRDCRGKGNVYTDVCVFMCVCVTIKGCGDDPITFSRFCVA